MTPQSSSRRYRVAMVCSHAVQYFMPWFRQLAAHPRIDLTVLLGDEHGLKQAAFDPGFGQPIRWDVPLTEGLHVESLKNHALHPGVGRFLGILNLGWARVLTRARFDAAVIHGWNYATYPLALLGARLNRLPVLLRAESPLRPSAPSLRRAVRDAILGPYVRACAGGLAVSQGNRRRLRYHGMPDEHIFHTPYAVDGARFALTQEERAAARAALRDRLGLPPEVPLILSVGKLQPVKAPGLLLSAYAGLRRHGARAALAYVGDGELRDQLEARVRTEHLPDVHFLGFCNQSELPRMYAGADLFVLPSQSETFGLVVNEAMYAGLPVICSDGVGCAEDLVIEGQTGHVFPVGDASRLEANLLDLCRPEAAPRRAAMGQAAARRIAGWTYAEATRGLIEALDAVVGPGLESN